MSRPTDLDKDIYEYAKSKLEAMEIFPPFVTRIAPTKGNKFPLVIIPEARIELYEETLKMNGEQKYKITYDIEIYAVEKTVKNKKYSKMTITNTILKELYKIFEVDLCMLGGLPFVRENMDVNVSRILVDFTCKYKDGKIYRR